MKKTNRHFLLKTLLPFLVVLINLAFYLPNRTLTLYPNKDNIVIITAYGDTADGGTSTSTVQNTDTGLKWSYRLGSNLPFAYAGVTFHPGFSFITDIRPYNDLKIRLQSRQAQRVRFQLLVFIPDLSTPKLPTSYRFFNRWTEVSPGMETIRFPLRSLRTPVWWFQNNDQELDDRKLSQEMKKRMYSVELITDELMDGGTEDVIIIESLQLEKNPFVYLSPSFLILVIYGAVLGMLQLQLRKKEKKLIYHKPLSVDNIKDQESKRLMDYLYDHFNDPELTLASTAKDTGISEKKTSKIINETADCSFRAYLNRLRLDEAKRQLLESDLNVSEIAYKVGYNSSSQFTRVFRQFEDCSPTDYRKKTTTGS